MTGLYVIYKKLCSETRYRSDKWKDAFDFKNTNLCNSLKFNVSKPHLESEASCHGSYLYCSW